METVKSRSESPFSRSKTRSSLSDTPEMGNTVIEQYKTKRKMLRNKSKSQANGKENEDSASNGKDVFEEEKLTQNENDNNIDSHATEHENGIENGNNIENRNLNEEALQQEVTINKENDSLINTCENSEEKIVNESERKLTENTNLTEGESTEAITTGNVEDFCTQSYSSLEITKTESSPKKNNSVLCDSLPESQIACENSEEICNKQKNDILSGETNSLTEQQEIIDVCSENNESSQVSVNGSESSLYYEEANGAGEHIQASPDTATKDDISVTNKITNFLGKWGCSNEQKQDSEVSSSKKIEKVTFNHPYLSQVSGRRGIKDRLNSSATVFSSKEFEAKTPENTGISLDDSFRVRTNPPCLNSFDLKENLTLRKFKGKRCLNAGDEPEEEDDLYHSTIKRRKLDERAHEPGLLGGILWSPFKKKAHDDEDQLKLTTAESKLSRLLSPFWFWKKKTVGQKQK